MTDAYVTFAERMFQKDSKYIPEILKSLVNDEQAELLVSLPGTAAEMAKKLGRPVEEIEADLKDMFYKGLTFKKVREDDILWRSPRHLIQFHDATILWPEAGRDLFDLWAKYMEEEWPELARMAAKATPKPHARIVPVMKSIETGKAQVLAPDDINKLVEEAYRYAVTKCTCRLTMKKCDGPIEVCLQLNRGADYTAGLVHVTMNKTGVGNVICNCCGCCCQSFPLLISEGLPLNDPSRFRPEVDADACSSCGDCEEACWFNAIAVNADAAEVNADKCMGCGLCVPACPEEAITLIEAREPSFIPGK
jgi:Pyruvate/2-oxoacid:ferredoxin oxidoreductase delta subunit